MDFDEVGNLKENDEEFRKGLNSGNIINNEELNEHASNVYNPPQFQTELLIKYFQNKKIFKKVVICTKCGKQCIMVKDKQRLDKYVWRCRSNNPSHDIKINIRANSKFEDNRISIQMIYFLLFYCFTEKKSINVTLTESVEFAKQIGIVSITKKSIIKFVGHIRNVIKEKMHHNWSKKLLGEDGILDDNGYIS